MRGLRKRILIIDSFADGYHERLGSSLTGCEIIAIPDYHEAGEFFFHNGSDLILLNYDDDASCFRMLRFIRSLNPLMPVIITASNGSEDLAVKVFRHGVKDYLKKPFETAELIASIKGAFGIMTPINNRRSDNIGRAVYCIHKYYNTKIRLSSIAREAGMSVSCFEKRFKKEKGVTFKRYVNELRISRAKDILKEDGLSMNDVAFACGFTNQFHFTRMFNKIAHVTPTAFKKSLRR
ncbi:MAG: response regulator transcription factor [Nitrospirae bacterium]|nr:response regulator transcription factor [Nitrospirota bacterium]